MLSAFAPLNQGNWEERIELERHKSRLEDQHDEILEACEASQRELDNIEYRYKQREERRQAAGIFQ